MPVNIPTNVLVLGVRHPLDENEASPQRGVQKLDGPVGGVHRTDQIEVVPGFRSSPPE